MASNRCAVVTNKKSFSKNNQGDRETSFFESLIGKGVILVGIDGEENKGRLLWVGPYSLLIEGWKGKALYWKHSLRMIKGMAGGCK